MLAQETKPSLPLISVIIPAYQAAAHIRQTLVSVQEQTYRAIEVIVVDDGSSDTTAAVVEEFMAQDDRIRLLRQENAGVGAARNAGIRQARGVYIAPMDADDLWAPTKLEKQLARMEQGGENTGLVYCAHRMIDPAGNPIGLSGGSRVQGKVLRALICENFIGPASIPLFRRAALEAVGLYLTRAEQDGAQGCEDWCLALRIAEKYQVLFVAEYLVDYRQSKLSMSRDADTMERSFVEVMGRVRERNPDLPARLFDWSTGNFYLYVSERSYDRAHYRRGVEFLRRAVYADPRRLISTPVQKLFLKSLVRMIIGPRRGRVRGEISAATSAQRLGKSLSGLCAWRQKLLPEAMFERSQLRRLAAMFRQWRSP